MRMYFFGLIAPILQIRAAAFIRNIHTQHTFLTRDMASSVTEDSLKEFYQYVYPVDEVVQWLSYDLDKAKSARSEGYLARREFCFTLLGDIFTRFRSYSSANELRQELVHRFPEKIDVGAVYNVRPNQKQQTTITAMERELVFDIDMTDYDKIRSCCSGKSICGYCWSWMSCAAEALRSILSDDFGFKYLLPIFSGRRGIHVWVCDKRARALSDDERAAIVGYMTVFQGDMKTSVTSDLVNRRPIHPTLADVQMQVLHPTFEQLFLSEDPSNPNSISHPKGAAVVYEALLASVRHILKKDILNKFQTQIPFEVGNVLDWNHVLRVLGEHAEGVIAAVEFMLMYPRLDEHVSTHRDHLLKLPFCIHPGTGRLCCPLEWGALNTFDPIADAPSLPQLLMDRSIAERWHQPLTGMLVDMSMDPSENPQVPSSLTK